jgi:hypothetical protein
MLVAGLAVGILAGGLVNPSGQSVAAPLLEELVASAPAAVATTAHAPVAAGAPIAAPATPSGSGGGSAASASSTTTPTSVPTTKHKSATKTEKLPAIRHVWLVVLSGESYAALYGPKSKAHYLDSSLLPTGTLLTNYYAVAHGALADDVALLSGQGPTPQLQANCPEYETLEPGTIDSFTGQARGQGCVFPATVSTLAGQFAANGLTWRAYIGGQTTPSADQVPPVVAPTTTTATTTAATTTTAAPRAAPTAAPMSTTTAAPTSTTTVPAPTTTTVPTAGTTTATTPTTTAPTPGTTTATPASPLPPAGTCTHPQLGASDPSAGTADRTDGYATWRNPFMYFHSVVDSTSCATSDVGLDQLATDLAANQAPNFSWIAPGPCSAGVAGACPAGAPSGAAAADAFLSAWIPKIEATTAYQHDGMIVIVSDQAPASGPGADSTACCGTIHYPNTRNAGGEARPGDGGGLTGALVLSPFAAKGATDPTPYDHFTLLRTIEDLFNFPYLGYAEVRKDFGVKVFR